MSIECYQSLTGLTDEIEGMDPMVVEVNERGYVKCFLNRARLAFARQRAVLNFVHVMEFDVSSLI
jgi:hypothetical protein